MTTKLNKPVSRLSGEQIRDGSKIRQLVVTLYPSGAIGLRPQGTQREELYPFEAIYHTAVKMRVASERAAKKKGKAK